MLEHKIIKMDFDELDNNKKENNMLKKSLLIINYKNIKYEFLVNIISDSREIFCFEEFSSLNNLSNDSKLKNEQHVNSNISSITYHIPDNTIDKEGNTHTKIHIKNLEDILKKLFFIFENNYKEIIFYGSLKNIFLQTKLASTLPMSFIWLDIPSINLNNTNNEKYNSLTNDIKNTYYNKDKLLKIINSLSNIPKAYLSINKYLLYTVFNELKRNNIINNIFSFEKNNVKILIKTSLNDNAKFDKDFELITKHKLFSKYEDLPDLSIIYGDKIEILEKKMHLNDFIEKDDLKYNLIEKIDYYADINQEYLLDELEEKNIEIKKLKDSFIIKDMENSKLLDFKNNVLSSTSWKITKPLRMFKK